MKNAIKVYVYYANEIKQVKNVVNTFYKHPVNFTEHKNENPQTYYDNWVIIESDYAVLALAEKIRKLCDSCVKTITFPKDNNVATLNGEEVVEKLRQAQIKKYHSNVEA